MVAHETLVNSLKSRPLGLDFSFVDLGLGFGLGLVNMSVAKTIRHQ